MNKRVVTLSKLLVAYLPLLPSCHLSPALGVIYEVWHPAHFPGVVDPGRYRLLQLPGQPGRQGGAKRAAEGTGTYNEGRKSKED